MQRVNLLLIATVVLAATTILTPPSGLAGQGTEGAQILDLGGGTRATALGGAFTAVDGDVTSALWNPSGLGIIQESQVAISYKNQGDIFGEAGEGLYYAFFAGAMPIGDAGILGATLQLEGQGTILVTTDSPNPIREENLGTNWVLTFSYADQLTERLSAGLNGKIIRLKLGQESGGAYAVDFGAQYDLLNAFVPIKIGAALQNWGTRLHFIDENQSDPLPRKFRLGTAVVLYEETNHRVSLIGDFTASIHKLVEDEEEIERHLKEHPDQTRSDVLSDRGVGIRAFEWRHMRKSIGVEYWLGKLLALRVGYNTEPGIELLNFSDHLTYGLGVRLLDYQFDYAVEVPRGPEGRRLNVFALLLRF
ncbi:MAG: PorV/PorQ family protein [Candidatus Poribacteria bacterium]|nr:PorV/PorQ family protein [Candidatus Poribacteria bacterium]MDE0503067.1 PorV/PorQ family protein [Candidatus Poribacteria bacterium]